MASEFYVAEDGSIHRHPVTVVNNTGNYTNTYILIIGFIIAVIDGIA